MFTTHAYLRKSTTFKCLQLFAFPEEDPDDPDYSAETFFLKFIIQRKDVPL